MSYSTTPLYPSLAVRFCRLSLLLWLLYFVPSNSTTDVQSPLSSSDISDHNRDRNEDEVPVALFASLERMSRLVDIAYCVGTAGISRPFTCPSRCRDFPLFSLVTTWNTGPLLTDSCGYIALDPGLDDGADGPAIIVAFRGTYSLTNTVIDLSTVPQEYVPYPAPPPDDDGKTPPGHPDQPPRCYNCTVHTGFLLSWRNARSVILPHLRNLRHRHPDYPVHLVGHSLGGAVATLAALEMRLSLGWSNVVVTTFGEPRVGNTGLSCFIDQVFALAGPSEHVFRRVTHRNDPVPLLPLDEWGFRPHSGEIHIRKRALPPSPADLRFCHGPADSRCIAPAAHQDSSAASFSFGRLSAPLSGRGRDPEIPTRLKLWNIFFAHRDYFWRLGLCVPGGDPSNWIG